MSIFGDLDIDNIPEDPDYVEPGKYEAVIKEAEFATNTKGERNLHVRYQITTEGKYEGRVVKEWLRIYEGVSESDIAIMPANEADKVRRNLSNLKKRLFGAASKGEKGFGVDPSEIKAGNWQPSVLKGNRVVIGVYQSKNGFTGVDRVDIDDSPQEGNITF